jgi:hypothetical protein
MRSRWLRNVTASVAMFALAGCAFTQWTERYFIGDAVKAPVHDNRIWTGAVILPFALLGDIITAPVQVVLLVIFGDDWLYSKKTRATGTMSASAAPLSDKDQMLAMVDQATQDKLRLEVERRIADLPAGKSGLMAWGVGNDGKVIEVPLTAAQEQAIIARIDPDVADAMLAARLGVCRPATMASK